MADFNISIRVSGTAGGQAISWTRTGTVADIDVVVQTGRNAQSTASLPHVLTESVISSGVGAVSYTGVAVCAVVSEGQGNILTVGAYDSNHTLNSRFYAPTGIPVLIYQGFDFNGAMNVGASDSATPTVDVQAIEGTSLYGFTPYKALAGLKAVS